MQQNLKYDTWVRGHIKDVHGELEFNAEDPTKSSVEITMETKNLWSGEKDRDAHLKSAGFLDVEALEG